MPAHVPHLWPPASPPASEAMDALAPDGINDLLTPAISMTPRPSSRGCSPRSAHIDMQKILPLLVDLFTNNLRVRE